MPRMFSLAVMLWFALCVTASAARRPADDAVPTGDAPTTVVLRYQEYLFDNPTSGMQKKEIKFKAEPKYKSSKIERGSLDLGFGKPIGYALDRGASILYVDLNCNGDLTDDPKGVITKDPGINYADQYSHIHATFNNGGLEIPLVFNIIFYSYADSAHLSMQSGWTGWVELSGKKWKVEATPQRTIKEPNIVISQGEPKTRGSDEMGNRVFVQDRLYRVKWSFTKTTSTPNAIAVFEPIKFEPCKLHIDGSGVHKIFLRDMSRGMAAAVLYDPPADIVLPQGNNWMVWNNVIKSGGQAFTTDMMNNQRLTLDPGHTETLVLGGPLKNTLSIGNKGASRVTFNYSLTDKAGRVYRPDLINPKNAPKLEITQGGRTIATGSFEYG